MHLLDRLRARWGVGPWGVVAIVATFSLAGITVVRLKGLVFGSFLPADAPGWLSWVVYLLVIFPLYHVCLLAYGTLFGQFRFFWDKFKLVRRWLFGR